ncbi:MAG: hypothetical protein AB1393_08825 [Candidatus Edwardsbacteria bacterium]
MNLYKEFLAVIKTIKKCRYLLIGGLAYSLYVEPRFTQDVDFMICEENFEKIGELLIRIGFLKQKNIIVLPEAKIGRCVKIFNRDTLIVDFLLKDKTDFEKIYKRREEIKYRNIKISVISPKDLIRLKQLRNSKQDQVDIENLKKLL